MDKQIAFFFDWIATIDLDVFASKYLQMMIWTFIVTGFFVLLWYSRAFIMNQIINNKLKQLRKSNEDETSKINEFDDWVDRKRYFFLFLNREWLKGWDNFRNKYREFEKNGEPFVPDIYDYIVEENLVQKYGNRKLIDIIPGIFVSAGILGTFIGLISGISGLTMDANSEAIRLGINDLLNGMSVAFYSSIMGITLSLVWQLLDKTIFYPRLIGSFRNNRHEMDKTFPTQDEGNFLKQMVRNQKEQMEDFQAFMSEQLIPQMVSGIGQAVSQTLQPHFEKTNEMVRQTLEQSKEKQTEGMQEMVEKFVEALNSETSDYMKELAITLQRTVDWQEKVHEEMSNLVKSMNESAEMQSNMVDKTTNLTEEIHSYTDKITSYQTVLQETVDQLNVTTDRNLDLQNSITNMLEKMIEERQIFDQTFERHMITLKENVEEMARQSNSQIEMQDKYESLLVEVNENIAHYSSMAEINKNLATKLSEQANVTNEHNESLKDLLEEFQHQGQHFYELHDVWESFIQKMIEERTRLDEVSRIINAVRNQQLKDMDERSEKLKSYWDEVAASLEMMNTQLSSSMSHFSEQMYQGLSRTFDQFDEELSKSIKHLASGVETMHNGVEMIHNGVEDLPQEIEKFTHLVKELNKSVIKVQNQA